jgi:hypothetical protein
MKSRLADLLTLLHDPRKYLVMSAVVILSVNLTLYRPVLDSGFWSDDYHVIAPAARLSWQDFLIYYVDPRVQWIWYRPLQGIEVGIQYALFGSDPRGYHVVQLLLHCADSLLLFGLVTHISRKWRIGLVTTLIYVTWSIINLAVYWPTVADPLLAFFCLLAVWFWIRHLETDDWFKAVLAYIALMGGLGTKENAAVMPVIFFLADRWLVGKPASLSQLFKRYIPFVFVLAIYAALQFDVVMHGAYTRDSGYRIGSNIVSVALQYLSLLVFPWEAPSPLVYLWLGLVLSLFVYSAWKRHWQILFIGAAAVLTIAPVMFFRGALTRYLYLPLMASAVGFALMWEVGFAALRRFAGRSVLPIGAVPLTIIMMIMSGSTAIADGALNYAEFVHQTNLKLRPIFQRHPSFPSGTLLYFIEAPFAQVNVAGALTLRYGAAVTVDGSDSRFVAGLRNYKMAYVYYLDDEQNLMEIGVDPNVVARVTPSLPVQFEEGISLEGFELANAKIKRGEATALILYWRATKKLDRDYTVFAHLASKDGSIIAGSDSQPKRGDLPTSQWRPGDLIVDATILPVGQDAPVGENLRMEIGLYYLPTMQRLSAWSASGTLIGDKIVIEPLSVSE